MRQAGLAWGLMAALSYATMNLCLRAAAVQADAVAGALIRSIPICLLGWSMVAWGRARGRPVWPGWRGLAPLALVGFLFNVTGNASFQLALAAGGLALTVPVSQGAVLWGGAVAGWWLMRERLTRWSALGLVLLALALPLLTAGAGPVGGGSIWLAALAAALAGLSYGSGNGLLRQTVLARGLSQGTALAGVATVGFLCLLATMLARSGPAPLLALERPTLGWLVVGGIFNALALGSLSRALSLLPVARVNALSTLQTAISAIGGVLIFAEPLTAVLAAGLALSLVGTVLAQHRPRRVQPAASPSRTLA